MSVFTSGSGERIAELQTEIDLLRAARREDAVRHHEVCQEILVLREQRVVPGMKALRVLDMGAFKCIEAEDGSLWHWTGNGWACCSLPGAPKDWRPEHPE